MEKKVYRGLGEEPDIDKGWSLMRKSVEQALLRKEFVAIPFLSSADCFNHFYVFIKERKFYDVVRRHPPTYKVIGHLDSLIDPKYSAYRPDISLQATDENESSDANFQCNMLSKGQKREKELTLLIKNCHATSVILPAPRSIILDLTFAPDLKKIKKIYIITGVVLSSEVCFMVRIDNREENYKTFNHQVPIGMRYRKFAIGPDGVLQKELKTTLKFGNSRCKWIPPMMCLRPYLHDHKRMVATSTEGGINVKRDAKRYFTSLSSRQKDLSQANNPSNPDYLVVPNDISMDSDVP